MDLSTRNAGRLLRPALALSLGLHLALVLLPPEASRLLERVSRPLPRLELVRLAPEPAPPVPAPPAAVPPRAALPLPAPAPSPPDPRIDSLELPVMAVSGPSAAELERLLSLPSPVSEPGLPVAWSADSAAVLQSYIDQVFSRIERARRYPELSRRLGQSGEVAVSFAIGRGGELLEGTRLATPSPHRLLNRAAEQCVRDCAPFPPLPGQLGRDTLPLTVRILYRLER